MEQELRDLYQELILDHKRHPRNFHEMADATRTVEGHNPLCGDHLRLFVKLEAGRIADVSFVGEGCAISTASASLLTEALKGKTVEEAETLLSKMVELLTASEAPTDPMALGKLGVLAGVRDYPSRVKCAMLPWRTLEAALSDDAPAAISTE
ncbi:MAG: Fe-S cluster assembly sulfur transfer protein SufU [Hydrogenophilus thermoluteolus]|jgi:nitrogen fixation NifU-like protein|uniref:Fe-S cluster assembly sulfur transfer protein SufU n=1 Tax=Hydrogenophilus thermoluteolus TaxID=297 RepID=UPI00393CCCA7